MPFPISRRSLLALAAATMSMELPKAVAADRPRAEAGVSEKLTALARRREGEVRGRLGVAIIDAAGETIWGWRANERFPMSSTFKAPACAAVLHRVDGGRENLERRVVIAQDDLVTYSPVTGKRVGGDMSLSDICAAAMTLSDNTAGNIILRGLGGPEGLTAFARSLGDTETRLDRWETILNEATPGDPRDTTTPAAMARTLRRLALGDALSAPSRERLVGWMLANLTGDTKLRAGVPADWRVADKTGGGGHGTNNDIAILWPPGRPPLVIAVYLTGTDAPREERDAVIADIGRVLADGWSR